MKISSLQYAKSLYESVQEKTPEEAGEIVSGLVKILFKKNQLRLKNEIIQKFEAKGWSIKKDKRLSKF